MQLTPISERARLVFHLQAVLRLFAFWVPMSLPLLGVLMCYGDLILGLMAWLGTLLVIGLGTLWWPVFSWYRWGYSLSEEALVIQRGVLIKRLTAIPTHRIQHVDTKQGPFEQLFGLARLRVYTASGAGADGTIPGLDLDVAESLRDRLVAFEGDDGV